MRTITLLFAPSAIVLTLAGCDWLSGEPCFETKIVPAVSAPVTALVVAQDLQFDLYADVAVELEYQGFRCDGGGVAEDVQQSAGVTNADGVYAAEPFPFEWQNEDDYVRIEWALPESTERGDTTVFWTDVVDGYADKSITAFVDW